MAVWPFIPLEECTEALSWYTDILPTYSAEQRIRLTDAPRQSFAYSHAMTHRQYERAKLLMQNGGASSWDLPVWPERQRVTVGSGASSVTVDTTASDYRVGGKAILWASDESYELVTIDAIAGGSLTLDGTTSQAYTDALVCPVRTAYNIGGLEAGRPAGPIVGVQAQWIVYDVIDLADSGLYSSYRSHPMVTDCPRVADGEIDEATFVPQIIIDSGLGPVAVSAERSVIGRAMGMVWMAQTMAELWDLRTWLHSVYGRQKGFWLPSWTNGITLTANISQASATLSILAIGLNGVAESGDLMLVTAAGVKHYFQYTAVGTSGANEVLTLSAAAGVTIATTDVARICLLHFVRLEQDRVEFAHRHLGIGRQLTTVAVRVEGVPIP